MHCFASNGHCLVDQVQWYDQNEDACILQKNTREGSVSQSRRTLCIGCLSSLTCCHEALFLGALQYVDDSVEEVRFPLTRVEALQVHTVWSVIPAAAAGLSFG